MSSGLSILYPPDFLCYPVPVSTLCYIAFGSNQGDREENLAKTKKAICQIQGCEILRVSLLYFTEPHTIDKKKQPWYLNCIFEIRTTLGCGKLFEELKRIEGDLGRVHRSKWEPRPADLDLLFFGNETIEMPGLIVPHCEISNRRFVLVPLNDLVPDFVHPTLKVTVRELLEQCQDEHEIKPFDERSEKIPL